MLGINNPSDTVGRFKASEKGIGSIYTSSQSREMLTVTEPGLYVWSSMMRKNHTESQLSIYAAEWRKLKGLKKSGPKKKGKAIGCNVAPNKKTNDAAGEKFGIGGRTVAKAANVLEKGCKQLQQAEPQKPKPPDAA